MLFERTDVEREERFGSFATVLEVLRPDETSFPLKEELRPVEFIVLLLVEAAFLELAALRLLIEDDEA